MPTREIVAAWLHVAAAAFVLVCVGVLWWAAAGLASLFEGSFIPELIAMVGRPVAFALLAFGALELTAAVGLLRRFGWARWMLVAVSVVQLPVFPIGTGVALFTLWALLWRPAAVRPAP